MSLSSAVPVASPDDLVIDAEADHLPAAPPTPAATAGRRWLMGLSVVLIGFNLRPVFSSLSVVLPEIMERTGLSPGGASALTTLPVVCLGLFAMLAPRLGRRFGTERTLLACLVLVALGTGLRGAGSLPVLFAATALAGTGIAVANVLMSGLIKRDFAHSTALMMGFYTMAVCAGAAGGAAFTVPIEHAIGGGWARALAVWALPAALVCVLWAPLALPCRPLASELTVQVRGLWRDALAWQVTLFMGLQSALAYIVMGWLAPILRERGLDAETAGYAVSVAVLTQVVTCLAVPLAAVRCRSQSALAAATVTLTVASLFGCLFAPLGGIWGWAVLLGIAQGGSFALALTLIVLRSPDSQVAAQLSGMAQGVGYLIAACGPMLAGLLRGWTGDFSATWWLVVAIGTVAVAAGLGAGRARMVQTTTTTV